MSPDERAFRDHLDSARFRAGVARGDWTIICLTWPYALVAVTADPRPGAPDRYFIRFDVTGYPQRCPTGTPWDTDGDQKLPAGDRPQGDRVGIVFRTDWNDGTALYAPYDRVALDSHGDWASTYAASAWKAGRDFSWLLAQIRDLLDDLDYQGIQAA